MQSLVVYYSYSGNTKDITITPLAENIKDIAVLFGKVATSTLKSVFGLPCIFKK